MATDIEIVNSAIAKLRGRPILSFNDNSVEARVATTLYHPKRKSLLRSHPWNFATRRVALPVLSGVTIPWEYTTAFQLPSDTLRLLGTDISPDEDWTHEGWRVLANRSEVNAKILYDLTDSSKFDACFCEVLSYILAADMALPLTNGSTIAENMKKMAKEALAEARSFDAQEGGSIRQIQATSWINSRY
jgi:hypothetical protein